MYFYFFFVEEDGERKVNRGGFIIRDDCEIYDFSVGFFLNKNNSNSKYRFLFLQIINLQPGILPKLNNLLGSSKYVLLILLIIEILL